jgi:DNA-binding response OmpR family regulator
LNREVLLIDDDRHLSRVLARCLAARGLHVTESSPRQVLAELDTGRHQKPGLIVTDLGFSDVDGMSLIAGLRARVDAPILVHTASPRTSDAAAVLVLGADGFVRKPCDPEELAERVSALLRRSTTASRHSGPRPGSQAISVGSLTLDATCG